MAQSVHDVAAAIIARHMPIDALKLQKIIFFAAGEYAAITGKPMFPEPVEAWDFGPVVHAVYVEYKGSQGESAISEATSGSAGALNDLELGCIESALLKYGEMSGARLIDETHKEPAWQDNYEPGSYRRAIPLEDLVTSFREKADPSDLPDAVLSALVGNASQRQRA